MDMSEGYKSMDLKSVKTFKTKDEYLYAMKEDLAEWLSELHSVSIDVDNFLDVLDTGSVLCQHANTMIVHMKLPNSMSFKQNAQVGSFQARDNLSLFIAFCRKELKIPDTLLFESEDLVSRKNERSVVLCLLEVGRKGSRFGVVPPQLVQLEQEIDEEIETEKYSKKELLNSKVEKLSIQTKPRKKYVEIDMMTLDEMVRLILGRCTCEQQYPMIRVSEGKYTYGDNLTPIFLRVLRRHVMVRTGGGWDTLESFLGKKDPCRCDSKEHRGTLAFKTPSKKKATTERDGSISKRTNYSSGSGSKSSRTETPVKQLKDNLNTSENTLHLLNNVKNLIAHTSPKSKKVCRPKTANQEKRSVCQAFKRTLNVNNATLNKVNRSQNVNSQLSRSSKSLYSSNENISRHLNSRRQSIQETERSILKPRTLTSQNLNTTSTSDSIKRTKQFIKTPLRPSSARPRIARKATSIIKTNEKNLSQSVEKLNRGNNSLLSNGEVNNRNKLHSSLNFQNKYSKSLNSSKECIQSEMNSSRRQMIQSKNILIPQSKSFVTPKTVRETSNSVQKSKQASKFKTPARPMSARPRGAETKQNVVNKVDSGQSKLFFSVEDMTETENTPSKSMREQIFQTPTPRRDLVGDSKTRIPGPVSYRKRWSSDSLKRSDSGVDITGATDDSDAKNSVFFGKDFY